VPFMASTLHDWPTVCEPVLYCDGAGYASMRTAL